MSNGTCLRFSKTNILEPPAETESGSAGTQPDEGYPGSGAPMARQASGGVCHQGPFSYIPLDTGHIPPKILRRSRTPAIATHQGRFSRKNPICFWDRRELAP